ncbi:MAG: DASS family sodium-coupled anion symporter [Negativicutes bacterium]|nr:DASS family sodium-coupled anion symporter [Negativicutes bacterium]
MSTDAKTAGKSFGHHIEWFRQKWGLPLAILCMLAIWFAPTPAGLTLVAKKALVLFAGIFVMYLCESMPLAVVSVAVLPLAVLLKVVPMSVALEGYSASTVYLLYGSFILAAAMVKTNLAERITFIILSKIGSSTRNITLGITLCNIVLNFLVPSATARTAILLPVCLGIIDLFQTQGRTRFSAGLLLTLAFTSLTISAGTLPGTVANPVAVEFIVKAGGPDISYMQWLILGYPPALLMTFVTWWCIYKVFKPEHDEIPGGQDFVKARLATFGPMSSEERRTLVVFLGVVVLWLTGDITKIDVTISALIGATALFLPGFGVLNWSDANKAVSWQILLIAGGGISLGVILLKTGAAKWLASAIFSALGLHGLSTLVLLIIVMLVVQYLHIFFVGTTAMVSAIIPVVLAIGAEAGIPPIVLALPAGMLIGAYPLLMFYGTNSNILVYGTGRVNIGDFPRVGVLLCTIACGVYALCAATYWRWLGFF